MSSVNEKLARTKFGEPLKESINNYLESRKQLEADPKYREGRKKIAEDTWLEFRQDIWQLVLFDAVLFFTFNYFFGKVIPWEVTLAICVLGVATTIFLIRLAFKAGE